jgi:hypothetical protein
MAMDWYWYHYAACIAFGMAFKMFRNWLGIGTRRGGMYARAQQGERIVTATKMN